MIETVIKECASGGRNDKAGCKVQPALSYAESHLEISVGKRGLSQIMFVDMFVEGVKGQCFCH